MDDCRRKNDLDDFTPTVGSFLNQLGASHVDNSFTSALLGGPGGDFRGVDEPMTITDIVLQSGGDFDDDSRDFDILLNAVVTADLAGVLAIPKPP